MSTFDIKMPKLGESITEGTILSWSVQVGDIVKEDDVLFEVNTAKVSAEIPAPVAGTIVEIRFKEGDTVPVGTVVAVIGVEGIVDTEVTTIEAPPVHKEEERWYSPVVLQLAREAKIPKEELDALPGTGYEGRLSKKDIRNYIERKRTNTLSSVSTPPPVIHVASTIPTPTTFVPASSTPTTPTPMATASVASSDNIEVRPMDFVRKLIADHMVMSKQTSPHVTNVVEVDVTKLVQWRERTKESFFRQHGVKLTYMPAIAEAVAAALVKYPQVNSSVDGYNILLKKRIHLGIAVSLANGNLIVPVVHDANLLNLSGLALSIHSLAGKARESKLLPEEIDGGTFTITNFGSFKMLFGTPIINQPQVAILGVGSIEKRPAVIESPEGDMIAIRHKMYLSLSFDHRVVDGSLGGNYLHYVADYLENWEK